MKTLLLLRHAKSSWAEPLRPDFERPLNERGRQAAPLMGRYLHTHALRPQWVVSSPATRTRQTTELVLAAAELAPPVRFDQRVYEASAAQLLIVLSELEAAVDTVLLIGHNPGCTGLLALLTGTHTHMPTAALACVSLAVNSWRAIARGAGRRDWLVTPRELASPTA